MILPYIGQTVQVKESVYAHAPWLPGVYLGLSSNKDYNVATLNEKDELVEMSVWGPDRIRIVRTPDKSSPSQFKIEFGPFNRKLSSSIKLKVPANDKLVPYLKKIREEIKQDYNKQ